MQKKTDKKITYQKGVKGPVIVDSPPKRKTPTTKKVRALPSDAPGFNSLGMGRKKKDIHARLYRKIK